MKNTLSVSPNKKEFLFGTVYLVLELTVLPVIITLICQALGLSLSLSRMNVIFFIVSFGFTTIIFRGFIKRTLLHSGKQFLPVLFAAVRGFLMYWAGNFLVGALVVRIDPEFANINDASITAMMQSDFLPLAICTVFFVPITEELLFRGVLFAGCYRRSRVLAFVISTVVFSAIHVVGYIPDYPWDTLLLCFIQYIPPSIALGWAYARSGSILSPMIMHIAINAIGIFAMR